MNKVFAKRVLRLVDGYGALDGAFCLRPAKHIISGIAIDQNGAVDRVFRYAQPLYDVISFLHLDYATLLRGPTISGADRGDRIPAQELAELISTEDALTRGREEASGFLMYLEEQIQGMRSRGVVEPALVAHRLCLAATFARINDHSKAIAEMDAALDLIDQGQPGLRRLVETDDMELRLQSSFSPADIRQICEAMSFRRLLLDGLSTANQFLDQREAENRSLIDTLWLHS